MRKITSEVCKAFENGRKFSKGNSSTDGITMFLHGNAIAKHTPEGIMITDAGWATNTTKERLNGLRGVSIVQKKGVWFVNGVEWETEQNGYYQFHNWLLVK